MRTYAIILTLSIIGCNQDRLVKARNPNCNGPCYIGDAKHAGVGACSLGRFDCGDDPTELNPVCVGSVGPTVSQCNGLDNDCDGAIDMPITLCTTACGVGTQLCNSTCTAKQPTPELCNRIDDDCDGIIDNPESLPIEFCYSGPPGTAGVGECRPGVVRCIGGQRACYGDVHPKFEKCDGLDNDCDGAIDDGISGAPTPMYDFVFILDNSGSMGAVISKLQYVASGWASKYATDNYRFALVTAPHPDYNYGYAVVLYTNLVSAQQFNSAMSLQGASGNGSEPTLDAVWMVLNSNNPLNIAWRPGAIRGVILFTDEHPQSYNFNPTLTEIDVGDAVQLAKTNIMAFVDVQATSGWPTAIPLPYGKVYDIYMTTADMDAQLDNFITQNGCK